MIAKRLIFFILTGGFLFHTASAQQLIQIKFTAQQLNQHLVMDSLRIQNLSQGGDTLLHWPDTTLTILTVGDGDNYKSTGSFSLFQGFPNPLTDRAFIKLGLPGQGNVELTVSDLLGRTLTMLHMDLQAGLHHFEFTPGKEKVYLITARCKQHSGSIRIINLNIESSSDEQLRYEGYEHLPATVKSSAVISGFTVLPGDIIRCIGYKDSLMAVLKDSVANNSTNLLSFGTNPPCNLQPIITYGGQQYLTVKIGTQCWMSENLNIGVKVNDHYTGLEHSHTSNNGIIEKYCYGNSSHNCNIYGGLYNWDEMMGYVTTPGVQGICPAGWHIPTETEWINLTIYLGGEGVAGGKMKATGTTFWYSPNTTATNSSGLTALGVGARENVGFFGNITYYAYLWSSSQNLATTAYLWLLYCYNPNVIRIAFDKSNGYSVRCLRNN